MNTPLSFQIAKLLKEKMIKIDTDESLFYKDEVSNIKEHQIKNRDVLYTYEGYGIYQPDENEYQTYRISEFVMWLHEKHGIWTISRKAVGINKWFYTIYKNDDAVHSEYVYKSPTKAYEAAIEYTLNNLI